LFSPCYEARSDFCNYLDPSKAISPGKITGRKKVSVLLELSMFPLDKGESVGQYVSGVVQVIRDAGVDYQLAPMGTIIETDNLQQALALVEKAYDTLESIGCNRVYSVMKFDIRKGESGRLEQKIRSVTEKIGTVNVAGPR